MRRYLISIVVAGLAVVFALPANAGPLDLLDFDGEIDLLEDNDWESFFDANGDNTVGTGDFVLGMLEIQSIDGNTVTSTTGNLTAILAAEITAVTPDGSGGGHLTFGAISAANYTTLQAGLPSLPDRFNSDVAVLVYEDLVPDSGNFYLNPNTGDLNTSLASATDGTLLFEFGFTDNAFASADITDVTIPLGPFDDILNFVFRGGLNLVANHTALINLLPVPTSNGPVDLRFTGNFSPLQSTIPHDTAFVPTDTDIVINPVLVPEPGSVLLFVLGFVGLSGGALLRNRRSELAA